ncbi:hypothetical protein FA727_23835 [Robertmurraya kyonggiensis]|uniref:Retrotransposon gag domain-containing protein n=1 Tax=Robertmurraya kyonggiensis TaxID=1037680 RepID=A0A4U1CXT7_9BACI|nr:hypothetical protein FA727_23835 [Robertmurraya kyonggiensis]
MLLQSLWRLWCILIDQFKEAFTTEYCLPTYCEAKRREFEGLRQGNMSVSKYEQKF